MQYYNFPNDLDSYEYDCALDDEHVDKTSRNDLMTDNLKGKYVDINKYDKGM